MFEFEIMLDKGFQDKTPTYMGKAIGCIDDYLIRTIKDENGGSWLKIGDVVVPRHKVEAIRVKAVES